MKSAGAVEVVCEKHSISRGRIAGGDFSWRAHGCVIARRPRGSNLMHLQLPALIQQEDLDILDRQKVAARVPRSEQPQSTKVNLTNCLKMRTWLRQAPPCPGVEVCSLQSGGLFPYTQLGRSSPPQLSAVLQGNSCVRLSYGVAYNTMMFRSECNPQEQLKLYSKSEVRVRENHRM